MSFVKKNKNESPLKIIFCFMNRILDLFLKYHSYNITEKLIIK